MAEILKSIKSDYVGKGSKLTSTTSGASFFCLGSWKSNALGRTDADVTDDTPVLDNRIASSRLRKNRKDPDRPEIYGIRRRKWTKIDPVNDVLKNSYPPPLRTSRYQ